MGVEGGSQREERGRQGGVEGQADSMMYSGGKYTADWGGVYTVTPTSCGRHLSCDLIDSSYGDTGGFGC